MTDVHTELKPNRKKDFNANTDAPNKIKVLFAVLGLICDATSFKGKKW